MTAGADNQGVSYWAKVEVLGHQCAYGRVTEMRMAGTEMLRVDIPQMGRDPQILHPQAVFRITLIDEDRARKLAAQSTATIDTWALTRVETRMLALPESYGEQDEDEQDEDEQDEVIEALRVPNNVLATHFALFCREVVDAVLDAAGFGADDTVTYDDARRASEELGTIVELLPADDLVKLARGEDLDPEHLFLRRIRASDSSCPPAAEQRQCKGCSTMTSTRPCHACGQPKEWDCPRCWWLREAGSVAIADDGTKVCSRCGKLDADELPAAALSDDKGDEGIPF